MARHMIVTVAIVFGVYAALLFVIGHPFVVEASPKTAPSEGAQVTAVSSVEVTQKAAHIPNKLLFKGPTIIGVQARINLTHAQEEVAQVWQSLLSNQALMNNVDWSKGNIKVYAYYSAFDDGFSSANLTVGFDQSFLSVSSDMSTAVLPTGPYDAFVIEPETGVASDKAWEKAFSQKNLVERHTLNRNGESVSADAIVISL